MKVFYLVIFLFIAIVRAELLSIQLSSLEELEPMGLELGEAIATPILLDTNLKASVPQPENINDSQTPFAHVKMVTRERCIILESPSHVQHLDETFLSVLPSIARRWTSLKVQRVLSLFEDRPFAIELTGRHSEDTFTIRSLEISELLHEFSISKSGIINDSRNDGSNDGGGKDEEIMFTRGHHLGITLGNGGPFVIIQRDGFTANCSDCNVRLGLDYEFQVDFKAWRQPRAMEATLSISGELQMNLNLQLDGRFGPLVLIDIQREIVSVGVPYLSLSVPLIFSAGVEAALVASLKSTLNLTLSAAIEATALATLPPNILDLVAPENSHLQPIDPQFNLNWKPQAPVAANVDVKAGLGPQLQLAVSIFRVKKPIFATLLEAFVGVDVSAGSGSDLHGRVDGYAGYDWFYSVFPKSSELRRILGQIVWKRNLLNF